MCAVIGTIKLIKSFRNIEDIEPVIIHKEKKLGTSDQFYFSLPSLWNHRMICLSLDDWSYQMINFHVISNERLKNFFMIGSHNICVDIEEFLSSLSIYTSDESYNPDVVQIEELRLDYHGYSTRKKNYSIRLERKTHNLKQNRDIKSKLVCAKYLILLINEIPFGEANMANYSRLVKWLYQTTREVNNQNLSIVCPKGW